MPIFKIAKTNDKNKIKEASINENKLYFYKESKSLGKLYFDFGNDSRIEIGAFDDVYITEEPWINDIISELNASTLIKFIDHEESVRIESLEDVKLNSLVVSGEIIYSIKNIDYINNKFTVKKVYSPNKLKWHDYY